MSHARIEALDARRLLSGDVGFGDLLAIANQYNNGNAWSGGDFDYDGDVDFNDLLASGAQSGSRGTQATLTAKGKLVLGVSESLWMMQTSITMRRSVTAVRISDASGDLIYVASFKRVKSIAIAGSPGIDVITLGDGVRPATIYANAGNDVVTGGNGNDTIYAGTGDDVVRGGDGNDCVYGDAGRDSLHGEAGDDRLEGNGGQDRIDAGSGVNRVDGGSATDRIRVRRGKDKVDGDGRDIMDWR